MTHSPLRAPRGGDAVIGEIVKAIVVANTNQTGPKGQGEGMKVAKHPESDTDGAPDSESNGQQRQHQMFPCLERSHDQESDTEDGPNANECNIPIDGFLCGAGKANN